MGESKHGEGLLVTYTFRFGGHEERKAFEQKAEKVIKLAERVLEEMTSEEGLEGGNSLLATMNRFFDQQAYKLEADRRQVETSTALLTKIAEGQEEERKARAVQVNVMNDVHRRLKQLEAREPAGIGGGQQKAPFRDAKNKPHPNRSNNQKKADVTAPPAAPTTSAAPHSETKSSEKAHGHMNTNSDSSKKESAEKFRNSSLSEQVEQFAQHQAGP